MTGPDSVLEIKKSLMPGQRLMGLDHGTKTIGVALSDPGRSLASPVETIRRRKFSEDLARLKQLISENNVAVLVVGLPLNMNGSEGPRAQSVRAFVANLEAQIEQPILLWDERWSTQAAERRLIEADTSRAKRRQVIDKLAAAYILQGFLDRLRAED